MIAICSSPVAFEELSSVSLANTWGNAVIGDVEITVLDVSYWRDWMPDVSDPGPDGGSPLRTKIQAQLHNSGKVDASLGFDAVLYDEDNHSYTIEFDTVVDKEVHAWDGLVSAGEIDTIEFVARNGPYTIVGTRIKTTFTWRDENNNTAILNVSTSEVVRTD